MCCVLRGERRAAWRSLCAFARVLMPSKNYRHPYDSIFLQELLAVFFLRNQEPLLLRLDADELRMLGTTVFLAWHNTLDLDGRGEATAVWCPYLTLEKPCPIGAGCGTSPTMRETASAFSERRTRSRWSA